MVRLAKGALFAITLLATAGAAGAQQQGKPSAAPSGQPAQQKPQPAQPKPEMAAPVMPDESKANLLIRTSIIALNQANLTGNYTVLLDLGAPAFRATNDSTRLAQVFGDLRQRKVDLSPILFFSPTLLAPPQAGANGTLRLVGFFPTTPERVNFDVIFQLVDGQWKVYGIGVALSPNHVAAASEQKGQSKPAPKPAEAKSAAKAAPSSNWDTAATSSITPTESGAYQLNLAPR